jgi:methionyl-tRNA formyltransferase
MLSRELSPIDWSRDAAAIHNQVRGLIPWPCACGGVGRPNASRFSELPDERSTHAAPGTVYLAGRRGIEVACGDGPESASSLELQAEGGRRMAASDYLLGHPMNSDK